MVEYRLVEEPEELEEVIEVQRRVWGMSDLDLVPVHMMRAVVHAGGHVIGAFEGGRLVGYVFGFLGMWNGIVYLHSHQLAVLPEYRNRGVGRELKRRQMRWALDKGVDLVGWTFDPAQSLNSYFNLQVLGAISRTFVRNMYGVMRDEINRGMPSDRLFAEWWIRTPRARAGGTALEGRSAVEIVGGEPRRVLDLEDRVVLIPVPRSIGSVRNTDPRLALRWRMVVREAFEKYFPRGYVDVGFLRKGSLGFHVLLREDLDKILWGRGLAAQEAGANSAQDEA